MVRVHSHYDNLKVSRDAPIEVIRAAYKSLSQKYHPDRNADSEDAARIMALVNVAYEVLSDPDLRKKHDEWIRSEEGRGSSNVTEDESEASSSGSACDEECDPLYDQAVEIVLASRRASISLVQRHLRIGYDRAARLMAAMEAAGLVTAVRSDGNREVLADREGNPIRARQEEPVPATPTAPDAESRSIWHSVGALAVALWLLASIVAGYELGRKFWIATGVVAVLSFLALKDESIGQRIWLSVVFGLMASSLLYLVLWLI